MASFTSPPKWGSDSLPAKEFVNLLLDLTFPKDILKLLSYTFTASTSHSKVRTSTALPIFQLDLTQYTSHCSFFTMSYHQELRDITNLPASSRHPPEPDPPAPRWKPSNSDTDNEDVPDHFTYCPPMCPALRSDEHLRASYFKVEAKVKEYLDSRPPPYLKSGLSLMNTMGWEPLLPPSDERPLVIVLMVAPCDIDRINQKGYETIVAFIRHLFDEPVPPFRFFVENRVLLVDTGGR